MLRPMACATHGSALTWLVAATLALVACGDDGASEGGGDDAAASTSTTSPGTDSAATTSGGSTAPDPTVASASASGDTTSGTTTATTSGADSSSGGSDTGAVVCEGLDADACMAEMVCMSIGGRPIVIDRDGACLGPREFIECQPAIGCDDVLSYACEGDDAPMYQFPDACLPATWVDCGMAPPGELMPCP